MSDEKKMYEVQITKQLKGSDLYNMVTDALDPVGRMSWVRGCKWSSEMLDAFTRQYDKDERHTFDNYLDNVDPNTVLMQVHMEDEEAGEGSGSYFIVKLTLNRILEGFGKLQQKYPAIAAALVNGDGDARDEDCLVQCIAYGQVVFG